MAVAHWWQPWQGRAVRPRPARALALRQGIHLDEACTGGSVAVADAPLVALRAVPRGGWLLVTGQPDHPTQGTVGGTARNAPPAPTLGGVSAGEFEPFMRRYERQILNFLWRMTGDEQSAYDLTQETFLRAWQHYATIQRYEQPRAWLFHVATNLALTHQRRRSSLVGGATSLEGSAEPGTSDPARRLDERDAVRWALLKLSPKLRAVLVLREVYGLSAPEAGHALGMKEGAVKMALWRAREQFRAAYLGEEGQP